MQRYVRCQIMQSAKLCKMQKYARCKIKHVKIAPMFCNDLSAKGVKPDLYLGRICTKAVASAEYIELVCTTVLEPDNPPLVCGSEIFLF